MMIIQRKHGYGDKRKYIQGRGFIDSLTSTLKNVGSYIYQNKDLIAKPVLGAVGNLAATGLTEGVKLAANRIVNKNAKTKAQSETTTSSPQLDTKSLAILQNIIGEAHPDIPIANIISGSGIKRF